MAEVLQTDFFLYVIVIFGRKRCHIVFYRNAGLQFPLFFQELQLLVIGPHAETVENSPVQVDAGIYSPVIRSALGGGTFVERGVVRVDPKSPL